MKNGPIYLIFKLLLDNLKYLTPVEWFKFLGKKLNPKKNNLAYKLTYSRSSVDIFIILKWSLILSLALCSLASGLLTILVWYLLLCNLYTYFYYHIWVDDALNTEKFDIDRIRRRFVSLILAVCYSDLCFAYLYKIPYANIFEWSENKPTFLKSIWFSISNSLAANYEAVKPLSDFANSVTMIQLVITFIFVTIILSKSIPITKSTK